MAGLVQLKVFGDFVEARIAKAMLEAYGMDVHLFDEHLAGLMFPPASLPGARLMVREDQFVEAEKLLADTFGSD